MKSGGVFKRKTKKVSQLAMMLSWFTLAMFGRVGKQDELWLFIE